MNKQFHFVPTQNISKTNNGQSPHLPLWKQFFYNKFNLFIVICLLLIIFVLLAGSIFYKNSSYNPEYNSFLTNNLPSSLSPIVSRSYDKGPITDYLFYLNDHKVISLIDVQNYQSTYTITYNPYDVIYATTKIKLHYILGTNHNGVDNLAILFNSFSQTFAILFIAAFLQGVLGIYTGTAFGYFYQGKTSKISFWIIGTIMIIPFLFLSILLFNLTGYSFIKAILILSFIGFFAIFYFSYTHTVALMQKEYIIAYKVLGLRPYKIIWRMCKINLFNTLPLIAEQMSLGLISLAALSFFNIDGIYLFANIGNLYKQLIDNPNNVALFIVTFVLSIILIILIKSLAYKIAQIFWRR